MTIRSDRTAGLGRITIVSSVSKKINNFLTKIVNCVYRAPFITHPPIVWFQLPLDVPDTRVMVYGLLTLVVTLSAKRCSLEEATTWREQTMSTFSQQKTK